MLVREKMTPNPITITRQTTVANALQLMRDKKIRRLPVLEDERLIGIVTDRDLKEMSPSPATSLSVHEINYLLAKTKISDILPKNRPVITIGPDAFLEEAALLMRENKIGGIPVMENNRLIGIITETNIFDAFIEIMGLKQEGARITIKIGQDRPGILAEISGAITLCGGNITHASTFGGAESSTLVFRINQGDIPKIMASLKDMGYHPSVNYQVNNGK